MQRICILGSGYVGLVTGACLAELGNTVTCVDTDADRVQSLQEGRVPFYEPGLEQLVHRNVGARRLHFTSDYGGGVVKANYVFLCLPTPASPNGAADLSILRSAVEELSQLLQTPYATVVIKSTAPVGTSAALERLLHRSAGVESGIPVVCNPEFLREGSAISDFMNPDRIVIGAEDREAAEGVRSLYAPLGAQVLITKPETAEMIKYASNAFLATKISFVNELADICEKVGADISLVAEGMGMDKRIGKAFLRPGVGYGGSCFPKDVQALAHVGAMNGSDPRLLRAVMEVNTHQFKRVLHKLRDEVGDLEGLTIAVWGIAYKPDTDDVREAPAIEIMRLLDQEGARVRAYDPVAMPKAAPQLPNAQMCRDVYHAAEGADAVLLLTEWNEFKSVDLEQVAAVMNRAVLIDGRNVVDQANAHEAGFSYVGVGRPRMANYRRKAYAVASRG